LIFGDDRGIEKVARETALLSMLFDQIKIIWVFHNVKKLGYVLVDNGLKLYEI
jgi:hypothetical protein